LRRIAAGIRRYVVDSPAPFILRTDMQSDGRLRGLSDLSDPLRTINSAGGFALAQPFVVRHGHYSTITGAGLREGCGAGTFRGQSLGSPLATVCGTNDKSLVVPFVTKHFGGVVGHDMRRTLGTVTGRDHHALTAAFLTKFYGTSIGSHAAAPVPTVTAGGGRGGGHLAEVRALLLKYHGGDRGAKRGQPLAEPVRTIDASNRFALVMIHGEPYRIVDIGMRMLQPHELFAAQGFPADYEIAPELNGKPLTKTAQIALAGNSVCPPVAEAIVSRVMRPQLDLRRTA
jgi:DNA (cytosine-5)-methyltransferase 1